MVVDIGEFLKKIYETIIIGAGIAGASLAYMLTRENQKVLVLDKNGIASGGSGAAGAFVSPKIGKDSSLQKLTNESFLFAKDFYLSTCTEHFYQTGVIRIPKDDEDAKKFYEYGKHNSVRYEWYTKEKLDSLGIDILFDSFYFPEAGVCDATKVCRSLLKDIEVITCDVKALNRENGLWVVDEYRGRNIVLSTGYESGLADLRYMGIRGTWGTRGDFKTNLNLDICMHQSISIGANIGGMIKLGATHEKEIKESVPCNKDMALKLKESASNLIDTSSLELVKTYCGMRAGSKDYFPLVGAVVDVNYMLEQFPAVRRGAKPRLKYIDNLYILNGLGGRGFVFAPLMAKILAEHIVKREQIDERVNPDRLFLRWARRL
jgi:tRNA 5-methylaminomethyl-2-thiouridine biosynthesis bifunctional protein